MKIRRYSATLLLSLIFAGLFTVVAFGSDETDIETYNAEFSRVYPSDGHSRVSNSVLTAPHGSRNSGFPLFTGMQSAVFDSTYMALVPSTALGYGPTQVCRYGGSTSGYSHVIYSKFDYIFKATFAGNFYPSTPYTEMPSVTSIEWASDLPITGMYQSGQYVIIPQITRVYTSDDRAQVLLEHCRTVSGYLFIPPGSTSDGNFRWAISLIEKRPGMIYPEHWDPKEIPYTDSGYGASTVESFTVTIRDYSYHQCTFTDGLFPSYRNEDNRLYPYDSNTKWENAKRARGCCLGFSDALPTAFTSCVFNNAVFTASNNYNYTSCTFNSDVAIYDATLRECVFNGRTALINCTLVDCSFNYPDITLTACNLSGTGKGTGVSNITLDGCTGTWDYRPTGGSFTLNSSSCTLDLSQWSGSSISGNGQSTLTLTKNWPNKGTLSLSNININFAPGTTEAPLGRSRNNFKGTVVLNAPINLSDRVTYVNNSALVVAPGNMEYSGMSISGSGTLTLRSSNSQKIAISQSNIEGPSLRFDGGCSEMSLTSISSSANLVLDNWCSNTVEMKNVTFKQLAGGIQSNVHIDKGQFEGNPACSIKRATFDRGTLVDLNNGAAVSSYFWGEDSESNKTIDGVKTTHVIKLSNPPIIIDWEGFPMEDLEFEFPDFDFSAPTISVARVPQSTVTPAKTVRLTAVAEDPDGNDHETPISINGATFEANGIPHDFTENQAVTIIARDTNGNTRSYVVDISNIDAGPPDSVIISQSNTKWTKNGVTLTATAHDDTKLHAQAYQWEFTPNSTGQTQTFGWSADRKKVFTENGTVRVQARDIMGNTTWSDEYFLTNIDTVTPTATVSYSTPLGTKVSQDVGVKVQIEINDVGDPVTLDSSGIPTNAVMWDVASQQWTSATEKTFYQNGHYTFWIRDAVGNINKSLSFDINQISTTKPVIAGISQDGLTGGYVRPPVVIRVDTTGSTDLADKPFSWDGGKTWTNDPTHTVYENGDYNVLVRDKTGNVTEGSAPVRNIDNVPPQGNIYLYKGLPNDWTDPDYTSEDYIWKIRIEASDTAGIASVKTLWDNGVHTEDSLPIIADVTTPGVYGAVITDKAGNETYIEKVVTAENINAPTGGAGKYTDITVPSTGSAGTDLFPGGASLQDLVFSPDGALNKVTGEFRPYPAGKEGIPVHVNIKPTRNNYVTGYVLLDGVKYPFDTIDGQSTKTVNGDGSVTQVPWKANGREVPTYTLIPIAGITKDMKNAKVQVIVQEWKDEACTQLAKEGSGTLYTSTQVSDPHVDWSYNQATDKLTVVATSNVAGIDSIKVELIPGSGPVDYTGPVTVGSAEKVKIIVKDKTGNETILELDKDDLPMLNGSGGGNLPYDQLPNGGTGANGSSAQSYHTSNRSADIYIIGGTRGNTDRYPSGEVYNTAGAGLSNQTAQ